MKSSRAVIGDVLKKYRDAGGDVVHVRHETPQGAPLFTPGTELAEEFSELSKGSEKEKVSTMILIHYIVQKSERKQRLTMALDLGDPQAAPQLVHCNRFERPSRESGEEEDCARWYVNSL